MRGDASNYNRWAKIIGDDRWSYHSSGKENISLTQQRIRSSMDFIILYI